MKSTYFWRMISFDNTEIAFKSKSNRDLKKAYWLFKMVGNPRFVKFGKWATNFAFKIHLPISSLIKKTIFHQFCGGESIKDCDSTVDELGKYGIGTILDYSVEGKTSEEDFEGTVNEIIATIYRGKSDSNIPFAVFKVTGIARFSILEKANSGIEHLSEKDTSEFEDVLNRVKKICQAAYDSKVPVFIDAEESWIQDAIDTIAYRMMLIFNKEQAIVFNTAQMYRHDRFIFLENSLESAKQQSILYGVKLVRGAYMEKERKRAEEKGYPSPIQVNKVATDKDFNRALELILSNIDSFSLCAGTHNEDSSELLTNLMEKYGIARNDKRIYFAQLLGMSDHISFNLSDASYNVAKYVPYGPVKEVMPYLLRRADENTSVAGQTSRELSLLIKEKQRRKNH